MNEIEANDDQIDGDDVRRLADEREKQEEAEIAELERRAREEETCTLADIWKELGVQ